MITTFAQLVTATTAGSNRLELGADIYVTHALTLPRGKTVIYNGYKLIQAPHAGISTAISATAATPDGGWTTFEVADHSPFLTGETAIVSGSSVTALNGAWTVLAVVTEDNGDQKVTLAVPYASGSVGGSAFLTAGVNPMTVTAAASADAGAHTTVTVASTAGITGGTVTITGSSAGYLNGPHEILEVVSGTQLKLDLAYSAGSIGTPVLRPGATVQAITAIADGGNGECAITISDPAVMGNHGYVVISGLTGKNGPWEIIFKDNSQVRIKMPYQALGGDTPVVSCTAVLVTADQAVSREQIYDGFPPGGVHGAFEDVYPEWWGLLPDYHDIAINSAIRSNYGWGARVSLSGGSYDVSAPLDLRASSSRLEGRGSSISGLVATKNWSVPRGAWEDASIFSCFTTTGPFSTEAKSHSSMIWMGSVVPATQASFFTGVRGMLVQGQAAVYAHPDKYISLISSTGYVEELSFIEDVNLSWFSGFGIGFHNTGDVSVINGLVIDRFWITSSVLRQSIPIHIPKHAYNCRVTNGTIDVHLPSTESIESNATFKRDWPAVGILAGGLHTYIDNIHCEGMGTAIFIYELDTASGITVSNVDANGMMNADMIHAGSLSATGPAPVVSDAEPYLQLAIDDPLDPGPPLVWLPVQQITNVTNAGGRFEITTASPHGISNRSPGVILDTTGVGPGPWKVTVTAANRFILEGSTYASGWTSGGVVQWQPLHPYSNSNFLRYGCAVTLGHMPGREGAADNRNTTVKLTNICLRTSGRYLLRDSRYRKDISVHGFQSQNYPNTIFGVLTSYERTGVFALADGDFPFPNGNGLPFMDQREIDTATDAAPIVITTTKPHGINPGTGTQAVYITDVSGSITAGGYHLVNGLTDTTFELVDSTAGGAGTGGRMIRLSQGTPLTLTGASGTALFVTSSAHGFGVNPPRAVFVSGVTGNTAANGVHTVNVKSSTELYLNGATTNATYVSGGTLIPLYDAPPLTILSVSKASPAVIRTDGYHGLANGQEVYISGNHASGSPLTPALPANWYTVTAVDEDEFSVAYNSTSWATTGAGGTVTASATKYIPAGWWAGAPFMDRFYVSDPY